MPVPPLAPHLLLLAGGVVLLWQSWVGNFHELVAGTEALPDLLPDSLTERF